jgi:hypothetical protein
MVYKTLHRKLQIEQHKPPPPTPKKKHQKNMGGLRFPGMVSSSCSTSVTRRFSVFITSQCRKVSNQLCVCNSYILSFKNEMIPAASSCTM